MDWTEAISEAVSYIEKHITEDITMYDVADHVHISFTKAFTRFHGHSPSSVRKDKAIIKDFAPLKLTISFKGGYTLDYRIAKKEAFTVLSASKEFSYKDAKQDIPSFWEEHYASGKGNMSAECMVSISTRRWGVIVFRI